ncbi:Hypothetical predicted protein [Mytilus galloprovincialis]|uniref:Peptidase S1 domain-containing protein n=1 Tax=Mytilus galloprovincialis TaxID=29158 RepID=A0A8B6BFJ7_MYTGA|nr:Hypothetical predicted protein [Mytilus galloprovincialis]
MENAESIQKYLRQFNADISRLEICEFHEIVIAKHAFKSGNKIKLCINSEEHYGTASFPMKDKHSQYYCATCKHVTVSSEFEIETDDGITLPACEYYESKDLDFSLLKLQNLQKNNIFCRHGIRTEEDCFVSGEILDNDILPNEGHVVYKWGATTGLTEGHYKGIICTKKIENEKYDIETFIIEGNSGDFSKPGDSGALVCMKPDSNVFTRYMAAFVLIGELNGFDGMIYTNMHACYRVSVPLMEMEKNNLCSNIKPCF